MTGFKLNQQLEKNQDAGDVMKTAILKLVKKETITMKNITSNEKNVENSDSESSESSSCDHHNHTESSSDKSQKQVIKM